MHDEAKEQRRTALSQQTARALHQLKLQLLGLAPMPEDLETFICTLLGSVVKSWPNLGLEKSELIADVHDAWNDLTPPAPLVAPAEQEAYLQRMSALLARSVEDELDTFQEEQERAIAIALIARALLAAAMSTLQHEGMTLEDALQLVSSGWAHVQRAYAETVAEAEVEEGGLS